MQGSDPGVATDDHVAGMSQWVCETGGTSAPASLRAVQSGLGVRAVFLSYPG